MRVSFDLRINSSNVAFGDTAHEARQHLSEILAAAANRLPVDWPSTGVVLRDINGNAVGEAHLTVEPEEED